MRQVWSNLSSRPKNGQNIFDDCCFLNLNGNVIECENTDAHKTSKNEGGFSANALDFVPCLWLYHTFKGKDYLPSVCVCVCLHSSYHSFPYLASETENSRPCYRQEDKLSLPSSQPDGLDFVVASVDTFHQTKPKDSK